MPRKIKEWIAKSDDTPVPPRVRLRVFGKFNGRCAGCGMTLAGKPWTCDHVTALINGGENREANLQPLGDACCNKAKNRADVRLKSKTYRSRVRHCGARKSRHPMPLGKSSPFKRKITGEIVRR